MVRYDREVKHVSSRLQFELFCLAFLTCLMAIWFTMIAKKDYVVFTDLETVPETSDFLAKLPDYFQKIWTR